MDPSGLAWKYPILLSSLGQTAMALAAYTGVSSGYLSVRPEATKFVTEEGGWKGCLAVGFFKAMTLSFGNAVYLHLPLGYIQMLKAFSPVTVLTLLVCTGVEAFPSKEIALSVIAIALCTAATTAVESHANMTGLFYMAMAQSTEGGALVITQLYLKKKKFSVVESQYILAPPSSAVLMLLACATGEVGRLMENGDMGTVFLNPVAFFCAATLGLAVNYLTFAVIQLSSSTMLKVLGTVRNVVAVIGGAVFFHEHIPAKEWMCYGLTLVGFGSYTYYSMNKPQQAKKDEPGSPVSSATAQ
eukprot:TRINITY_DN10987_c0_g1_i1.p1 TRINITY_DN10987_c0_g1~~TRINITY_DN10987_c0_g1_i1.p1  ORF type:complete len:300 (+),score=103.05 TRINITY_DN10987_c0_g1_i1:135-1034(+)